MIGAIEEAETRETARKNGGVMSETLSLSIATPLRIVLDESAIASLRGEDASGGFGILPGHADFVTVIDAGVLRWRKSTGSWHYCVVRGGIFTVSGGHEVHVACRDAVIGDDLARLQAQVCRKPPEAREDAARRTRTQSCPPACARDPPPDAGARGRGRHAGLDGEGDEP
jgi:F-type H+-transporting ATPase subunit epsilon